MPNLCLFTLAFIHVHMNTFLLPLEFTRILQTLFTVIRFPTKARLNVFLGYANFFGVRRFGII